MGKAMGRPEELINRNVKLLTATRNITTGLGTLALLWSTVVLLGGFVGVLRIKEFWVLTGLSILLACRMVDNYDHEFKRGIYVEEAKVISFIIGRQDWIGARVARRTRITMLVIALLPKFILLSCLSELALKVTPCVSIVVSLWRLIQRDYGDAGGGDISNRVKLTAALDIFYALVLFQSLFAVYWASLDVMLKLSVFQVAMVTKQECGDESWSPNVVVIYYKETRRRFNKDGELPSNWNLITYALGLLHSASGNDHLWGARVLDKLFDKDASVRQQLLSSTISVQNLIAMIGLRGTADNVERRERAARILAHLATDVNIEHLPGIVQCICSLLLERSSSCRHYSEPQVTCPSENNPQQRLDVPDEKDQQMSLETSQHQEDAHHMLVPIEDQTDHDHEQVVSSSPAGLAKIKRISFVCGFIMGFIMGFIKGFFLSCPFVQKINEFIKGFIKGFCEAVEESIQQDREDMCEFPYESRGAKELISNGMLILERLTRDEENCAEISRHQRLFSMITSPLSSPDFLSNVQEGTVVEMLSKSLTVVSRLLTCPGDGATRLRQELASNTEAVSNLMAILETDSEGAQQLHEQALEILTELAFDGSSKNLDFSKLLMALLRIFLEEEANNTTVVEANNTVAEVERAGALRGKAGEALARLLPIRTARDANIAGILSKQKAIHLLTKVLDEILSSEMGTSSDGATWAGSTNSLAGESDAESEPPEEADSVQPSTQGSEKESEERKFVAAMLSLAVVICNDNVISKEDFALALPEAAALVNKLKEILEENKQRSAECLGVVKLTCHIVMAMIQIKPSCIQHFNEQNFEQALTEALETMSEVDDCMLFSGNDREVIKPARSLASLVKEAQELLKTVQEQGN